MAFTRRGPFSVTVGGANVNTDPNNGPTGASFDWIHADVNNKTGQVAVSFHTHQDALVSAINHIKVTDAKGRTVIDAAVTLPSSSATFPLALSYVTTTGGYKDYVIHVHNYGTAAQTVNSVVVDGAAASGIKVPFSVPAGGLISVPTFKIRPSFTSI